MVIILGNGGNAPDLSSVGHFYETWFGRPCCVVCTWNPGFYEAPDYVNPRPKTGESNLDSGGGYADNYPSDCWYNHVVNQHKALLMGKAFKKWGLTRGGYVAIELQKVKASDLDVKVRV